ncbi:hypothetical protein D3C74_271960 [compost metagenome]
MERNMDIVRDILLLTETLGSDGQHPQNIPYKSSWLEGVSEVEFYYHVKILVEAGYLEANRIDRDFDFDTNKVGPEKYYPTTLTWQGHEFLDSIRDNGNWSKVKKSLGKQFISTSFAVIATVAGELAKEAALSKLGLK